MELPMWVVWSRAYFVVIFLPIMLLMTYGGAFFIPVAAIVSGIVARRRGLNPRQYAVLGGIYSALLFFPWVYLLLRMFERRMPRILIRSFYILAQMGWLAGILLVLPRLVDMGPYFVGETLSYGAFRNGAELVLGALGFVILSFGAWLVSAIWLLAKELRPEPVDPSAGTWGITLPRRGYLVPLALAALSTWAVWPITLL